MKDLVPQQQLRTLISAVQLQRIRLVEVSAKRKRTASLDQNLSVDIAQTASVAEFTKAGNFEVLARIEVKVSSDRRTSSNRKRLPKAQSVEISSLTAEFELTYKVPKGLEITAEVLHEFANVNAIYNVWPYWREVVQDLTSRMDMPTLTLPVFRIIDKEPPIQSK
jgi:preprotein translocase subunit SecB